MATRRRAGPERRPPAPARRRALLAGLALLVAFGGLTARLLVWPAQGGPARASAIVMLAGPGNRLPLALALARRHVAPVLAISQGFQGYGSPCPPAVPGVKLICFEPDPASTRGEAEFAARLAEQYHWTSVLLVATRSQDTRARIVLGRCFPGSIYVATAAFPARDWPYELTYGWGALLKALVVHRSC